jgi:heavy metal sensor kinase
VIAPRSLEFRLTAWYSSMLFFGYLLFGLALWLAVRYAVSASVDNLLLDRVERLAAAVAIGVDGPEEVEEDLVEYVVALPESRLAQVRDEDDIQVYPSAGTPTIPWQERAGEALLWTVTYDGIPYRVVTREVSILGRSHKVLLASSLQSLLMVRDRITTSLLVTLPLALLICSGGGFYIARRALKPLDRMADTASGITVGRLSERLEIPPTGDSLERLARTFNEMLERLETSVRRIEQFSTDASHELRTPLAVIRTTAELALRHGRAEEEYRGDLKNVHAEAERLTELIEVLLAFAREDVAGGSVAMSEVDLVRMSKDVCRSFEREAASKGLTLRHEACDRPVVVTGNDPSLRRLVTCLLENALAHTRSGSITVSVSDDAEPALSVTDTGDGIPEESLGRIFDRFYRVDASRNRATGGHGLGLSIAQRIARHHDAEIFVESRLGEGSRFTVRFRRRKEVH